MNNTPRCANANEPGPTCPWPPPTSACIVIEWCGASNGAWRISSAEPPVKRPRSECSDVTSTASVSDSGGRIDGRRSASIVFPAPGGPKRNMWWPPAAAISSARRAVGCPRSSARSGIFGTDAGSAGTAGSSSVWPYNQATSVARFRGASTVMPSTSAASLAFSGETIAVVNPACRAAMSAGSVPGTERRLPSRPSSASRTAPSSRWPGTMSSAHMIVTARARSAAEPVVGSDAGPKLTETDLSGKLSAELAIAERTLVCAWLTTLSGRPDMRTASLPLEADLKTEASTVTTMPVVPIMQIVLVRL